MADGPIEVEALPDDAPRSTETKKSKKAPKWKPTPIDATSGGSSQSSVAPPTKEEIVGMLVQISCVLSVTVEEKFWPFLMNKDENGDPGIGGVKPHIVAGAEQMMPWMSRYGAALSTMLIWTGLVAGMGIAFQDGLKEIPKYVSGKKKPIFMRDDEQPDEGGRTSGDKSDPPPVDLHRVS